MFVIKLGKLGFYCVSISREIPVLPQIPLTLIMDEMVSLKMILQDTLRGEKKILVALQGSIS